MAPSDRAIRPTTGRPVVGGGQEGPSSAPLGQISTASVPLVCLINREFWPVQMGGVA